MAPHQGNNRKPKTTSLAGLARSSYFSNNSNDDDCDDPTQMIEQELDESALSSYSYNYSNNRKKEKTEQASQKETKVVIGNQRNSRLLALVLGVATLLVVSCIIGLVLKQQGIRLHNSKSAANFETIVSMSNVESHDAPEDCWMVLDGYIYDLTNYKHPGGDAYIHGRCGRDGTKGFYGQHSKYYLPLIETFARGKLEATEDDDDDEQKGEAEPTTTTTSSTTTSPGVEDPPVASPVSAPVPSVTSPVSVNESEQATAAPAPFCISPKEVQRHSVPEDCYYILYGDVFDFTFYIDEHPGGPQYVENECGTDATVMYETARKHTIGLLQRRGGYDYYLAPACSS